MFLFNFIVAAFAFQQPLLENPKEGLTMSIVEKGGNTWTQYESAAFQNTKLRVKHSQELCDSSVKQITGYIDVEERSFFFWFFESRSKPASDPLILWLNGGPGCSSLTGLFMELGPCIPENGGKATTRNPHSWNNNASIIFLDQPTNVGFSYAKSGEGASTTTEAAGDVFAFLQLFLQASPKYAGLNFHVTGESYAGHYIPAIAHAILTGNNNAKSILRDEYVEVKLDSIAIGNGLTDPLVQYGYYSEYACGNPYGPLLEESECNSMKNKYGTCKNLIGGCYKYQSTFSCVPGAIYCNNALISPFQKTGKNIYDVRLDCEPSNPLCYPGCNMDVNLRFMMAGDWMRPYVDLIPQILASGIEVLIYAGDADYICNYMGNHAWALALEWPGKEAFNAAPVKKWVSKGTGRPAGEYQTSSGLTYLTVYEAGHMVPYDQPEHSSEFINMWISPRKFGADE